MNDKYVLDGHNIVICNDLMKWAKWFETADKAVAKTDISDEVTVSTVFLSLDHNFNRDGNKPILFETMVFGGKYDQEMERYTTWEQAEKGHKRWVDKLKPS